MALDTHAKRKAKLMVLAEIRGLMSKIGAGKMKEKLHPAEVEPDVEDPAEGEEVADPEEMGEEGDDLALLEAAKKPLKGKMHFKPGKHSFGK